MRVLAAVAEQLWRCPAELEVSGSVSAAATALQWGAAVLPSNARMLRALGAR